MLANGTMVDGEVGYSGKKTLLEDGSAIGILLTPTKDRVLFGYSFSIGNNNNNHDNNNNNKFKLNKFNTTTNGKHKVETKPAIINSKSEKINIKTNGNKTIGTKLNGTKTTSGNDKEEEKGKDNEKKANGVFLMPAPKSRTTSSSKSDNGFLQGLRFALVGYDEATLSGIRLLFSCCLKRLTIFQDPKKKKLIKDLCDQGATYPFILYIRMNDYFDYYDTYVIHPSTANVDVVVLNRNYFKNHSDYNIDLPSLTSSLHIRFLGNTRYLEDCLSEKKRVEVRSAHEILPPKSGGVVVLHSENGNTVRGVEPYLVSQLASLLREEKKRVAGVKWKVVADLATISSCAGMLEGLEGATVEVLKSGEKGKNKKGEDELDFMLGIREAHAAGYRHALLLVNKKEKVMSKGVQKIEKVVSVVDAAGFSNFALNLSKERNKKKKDEK